MSDTTLTAFIRSREHTQCCVQRNAYFAKRMRGCLTSIPRQAVENGINVKLGEAVGSSVHTESCA
jgi:hypothetical protein